MNSNTQIDASMTPRRRSKAQQQTLELLTTGMYVAFWAEVGVLTRIYVDKVFTDGCTGYWGFCLLSQGYTTLSLGAYFPDLAANMLGCFFMGLAASSATLNIKHSSKGVGCLPHHHPWQANEALHVGVRTGFCGSLTTFASWELSMIQLLIGGTGRDGGQWPGFFWGFIVGLQLSLSSYVFGQHVALFISSVVEKDSSPDRPGTADPAAEIPEEDVEMEDAAAGKDDVEDIMATGGSDQSGRKSHPAPRQGQGTAAPSAGVPEDDNEAAGAGTGPSTKGYDASRAQPGSRDQSLNGYGMLGTQPPSREQSANAHGILDTGQSQAAMLPQASTSSKPHNELRPHQNGSIMPPAMEKPRRPAKDSKHQQDHDMRSEKSKPGHRKGRGRPRHLKTHLAVVLLLLLLTALFAVLTGVDRRSLHRDRRSQWLAVLFAPLGATLRWQLSQLNFKLPGGAKWFPLGTFVANMVACAIDFSLAASMNRAGLAYWGLLLVASVRVGFSGALSTVSTLVAEIYTQFNAIPAKFNAYIYIIVSIGTGAVLGIVIYGWSVWAYLQ